MNATEFIQKWRKVQLTESAASQEHFLDLCALLGHPTPAAADPEGASFTFERGAAKRGGGDGWADVWKKGFFAWEYKGRHKDLNAAYAQLLQYHEALDNPPLLVACDMDRLVVHTKFSGFPTTVHEIALGDLATSKGLDLLRAIFLDFEKLRPERPDDKVTEDAARHIAEIAQSLRDRGLEPHAVARFLDRIVFCLFAEDVGLLPQGLFSRIVDKTRDDAARFAKMLGQLFEAMAQGGDFGMESIPHFNGDLFTEAPVLDLTPDEIQAVQAAAKLNWSDIQPSIFGTLFERGLDPSKRSQLGAHYTSRDDIVTLVEPVVMQPLRREWDELRATLDALLTTGKKVSGAGILPANGGAGVPPADRGAGVSPANQEAGKMPAPLRGAALKKARDEAITLINRFLSRLTEVKVLDPACGSGNFLYVTLQLLKDLEKAVITYAADSDLGSFFPYVLPTQLYGIEINPYAFELAQMTVWIGYLQWNRNNGFPFRLDPVLRPMRNFECKDAILDLSDPEHPKEPEWPRVDFIVGNPPFLGGNKIRRELGEYVDRLFVVYEGRVPAFADLCCYWFERARKEIEQGNCHRAGLLATQGIRGGANREVLKRITCSGGMFFAESDRPWVLDGAAVHVSMIGFGSGAEGRKVLDGHGVPSINPNLTSQTDVTTARQLGANAGLCLIGTKKAGAFNVGEGMAMEWLAAPNPHRRPNSDLLRPWLNGMAITKRPAPQWILDCGEDMSIEQFALYEAPFRYATEAIKPEAESSTRALYSKAWWLHERPRPEMRSALSGISRYIATPRVSKFRLFTWVNPVVLCDDGVFVFARSDDFFLGVLHSRLHEVWALKLGTRLETRPRYTPTTCFETFPFPEPTPEQEAKIAEAARELNELRENWLNPPAWTCTEVMEFPGSVTGPWARYVVDADARGIGTVRYPRLVAKDAESAKLLKAKTLTNLYNQRPTWLDLAHQKLDAAVFAAYGWDPAMGDEEILEKLLGLNLERAGARE